MPSEPLPWDRKEFFVKDRKHERGANSDGVGGAGCVAGGSCSTSRWREPYHGPQDFHQASPRRPFLGQYKHGGGYQQFYPEESNGHGCTPSLSGDRIWPEDEIFRPSSGRGCGAGVSGRSYSSGGRESRGSYRRFSSLDSGGGCSQPLDILPVTAQRSVVVPITHASSTSSSPTPFKDYHNKSGCGVIDDAGTCQRYGVDRSLGSIAWKPLKWTRPSNLPSSSKTVRTESEEAGLEISVPQVKESPLRSPVTSPLPSDDGAPRKKPRLGWGQGLAKYEKQKVERSVDVSVQNGSVQSSNNAKDFVSDSSPKITGYAGSMSPATPTSATCSSSPAGTDEKLSAKGLSADTDRARCSDSSGVGLNNSQVEFPINLDQLDASSTCILASLLTDLMQLEDAFSGDSSFTRHSTAHKLLLLKNDISKELEKTESEIDLFENELKIIHCDEQSNSKEFSFTSQVVGVADPSAKLVDASKELSELSFSNNCVLASSVVLEGQQAVHAHLLEEHASEVKNRNHNSSGNVSADLELACLERKDPCSSNLQSDTFRVNCNCCKRQSSCAEPLIVGMTSDICSHELGYCLDLSTNGKSDDNSVALIISSNRGAAKRASHAFDLAVPSSLSHFKIWEFVDFLQCRKYYILIKEKLAMNKRLVKFKEHVLALKFRALHHLWREDLRVLTIRKHRPKLNKCFELNSRSLQTTFQKHRSSIRSRFVVPAGTLILVPTTEILNYTSKLLLDSEIRIYRNNLKMPAQIIDERDRRYSRFNSNNGLIEDPPAFEKERVMMNPWMQEEKELFLEMLATYGKDFKKISTFLNHKTTADCIEFYYKNHKSYNFTQVKRLLKRRNQWHNLHSNAYLITSATRNREANAASLDFLGVASMIAAQSMNTIVNQKHCGRSGNHDARVSHGSNGPLEKASNVEVSGNERETAAADVLAGICGALSSEAMSSCVTSSIDPAEKMHLSAIDLSLTPEATQTIDEEDTSSYEGFEEVESADWIDEEKSRFIKALNIYGKDFLRVSHFVRTRSRDQCKIFFSKARKCLGLDAIQPGSTNVGTPVSDANGGRSDTDDACAAEIDSAMCSIQSCSKMDVDFTQSMLKICTEGYVHAGNTTLQTNADKSCVLCEIGGAIPDDFECKFDKQASLANENRIVNEGGNLELGKDQGEIGRSFSRSNELEHFHAELQLQTTAEVPRKDSIRGFTVDELKSEVDMLLDPDVESRPPVIMEESGNVGESFFFASNSQSNGTSCNVIEPKNDDCPALASSTSLKHQVPLELLQCLLKSSETKIVKSEPGLSCSPNSVSPISSSICFDEADRASSLNIFMKQGSNWRHESVGRDYQQQLLKNPLSNQANPSLHIIKGYPLRSLSRDQKELKINRNIIDQKAAFDSPTMEKVTSPSNSISQSDCSLPELNNQKCIGVGLLDSKPVMSLPPRTELKSDTHLTEDKSSPLQTAYSRGDPCVELEDRSQRIGDLKLFGQILTHPYLQKSCSSQEGDIVLGSPRQNASAITTSSSSLKDVSMVVPGPGSNGVSHQQVELPQRSYGFWDGNMIQTGFSSLPESSIMLEKYQGSFNGMTCCMVKDGVAGNTAIRDYQQHGHMQSLSADTKLLDAFPELHKQNGFDGVSGYQQQGRMVHLGVNMAGGGIVVGGTGLSDPVAALQMHFSGRRAKMVTGKSRTGDSGGR